MRSSQNPAERFSPGNGVRVIDGTFKGMEGIVLSPEELRKRQPDTPIPREVREGNLCWVLLTIFGREVPVNLAAWQITRSAK